MKFLTKKVGALLLGLSLGLGLLSGCKRNDVDKYFAPAAEPGYFNLLLIGSPTFSSTLATKFAPGETLPVAAIFNQSDVPKTITVFQATRVDSAQVSSAPGGGVPVPTLQVLSQPLGYTVPTTYANGTLVRVDVTGNFAGGPRTRTFRYLVANSPTVTAGSPLAVFRNGLAANAQSEGDLVGYTVVINAGGVSALPAPTNNLFKSVDSLVVYSRLGGTGAPVRLTRSANPTAGVASTLTVNLRLPAGSAAAGGVSFVFTAFAQSTSASFTTPLQAVQAATPFRTTRRGRVSFGGGLPTDSLAFNLVTGLNEPAANPVAGKDVQVSGLTPTGVITLNTPNTTRYYRLTAAQLAATPYATATANAVGTLLFQNTTSADLGTPAVGDVYAVRLRGTAETMLLRIVAVRPSVSGGLGRVVFEYRSL